MPVWANAMDESLRTREVRARILDGLAPQLDFVCGVPTSEYVILPLSPRSTSDVCRARARLRPYKCVRARSAQVQLGPAVGHAERLGTAAILYR